ncbi:hypothetical protein E2C01_096414 [Portunus trituberculatus]|uniref:Uncharacterized protein n=1 Tax=Portunus trituberculatus TaxID=210409 RepID=A0A5B7K6Y1_PORTR|nr:hypothetical protein [Portunus trituberculatus]
MAWSTMRKEEEDTPLPSPPPLATSFATSPHPLLRHRLMNLPHHRLMNPPRHRLMKSRYCPEVGFTRPHSTSRHHLQNQLASGEEGYCYRGGAKDYR